MKAIILVGIVALFCAGLPSLMACGPSAEELYQQQLEQAEAIRRAEQIQVIVWNNQIIGVLKSHRQLMDWWIPIQVDFNRQLGEGKMVYEEAEEQREDQLSSLRNRFGQLYAIVNTIQCPNSCWEAHQTLLKYLDIYQSQITSAIAYNSMDNESYRLDANTKLNECIILRKQFNIQYSKILQEWNLTAIWHL